VLTDPLVMSMNDETKEQDELNSYEVLAIAVQLERTGAEFYRKAAALFSDAKVRALFEMLLQWEQAHIATFTRMRDEIAKKSWERGTYDPTRVSIPESQMMAGLAVFGIHPGSSDELTGRETREQVLRTAIDKEKDAVVFYTGLKRLVYDPDDQATVDDVIKEEMHHVRILNQALG
jgi:rubrerythrin